MYRKILLWNKVASVIMRMLSVWLLLASYNCFYFSNVENGFILLWLAIAFILSGIGVYVGKKWVFMGIKVFFTILIILGVGVGMLTKINHHPLSFEIQEMIWIACLLLLASFIVTLEIQQRRLKQALEELPTNQTSNHRQRISAVVVFVVVSVLTVVYFIIGRQAQMLPEVPDTYFDKTRENPNLPEAENGYEELRKLIGDVYTPLEEQKIIMEKYPFIYQTELWPQATYWNGFPSSDPAYLTTPRYRIPINKTNEQSDEQYATLTEYLVARPNEMNTEKLEILMQSDFFDRLERIVAMQRKNTDLTFPTLQNIQSLERVMQRLVAYYADMGDLETAIRLNIIALKLGDKYLSSYSSLVQGLIGIVTISLATNGTEYLLSHHELSEAQKLALLETYQTILTTNKEEVLRNIFKGEYHTMRALTNGFDFNDPDEINGIDDFSELSALEVLLLRKPFYDRALTISKYQYALQKGTELVLQGDSTDELPIQVDISTYVGGFFQKPQARNWYNFVGNMVMSALLPRFTGSYLMLKGLYQQKELLLQQLQSQ